MVHAVQLLVEQRLGKRKAEYQGDGGIQSQIGQCLAQIFRLAAHGIEWGVSDGQYLGGQRGVLTDNTGYIRRAVVAGTGHLECLERDSGRAGQCPACA